MKAKSLVISALITVLLSTGCSGKPHKDPTEIIVPESKAWEIKSPNEKLSFNLNYDYGKLTYNVKKESTVVVDNSELGFVTNLNDMTALSYVSENIGNIIPLHYTTKSGKVSEVNTSYRDATITFEENEFYFDIIVRIFNDGYGFKYGIRAKDGSAGHLTWEDENTYFKFPNDAITYSLKYVSNTTPIEGSTDEYYAYEGAYDIVKYSQMGSNTYVYPLLYKVNDSTYSLMNEVDLVGSGYHGSMLSKKEEGLKIIHAKNSGTNPSLELTYPFQTPWRMASVGTLEECLATNVYEDMMGNVEYWKPDNYDSLSQEEKETYNYDWVDAAPGMWNYLLHRDVYQSNYEWQKQYVDVIKKMGWKWIVLDAGWNDAQPEWKYTYTGFKKFTSYCHDNGIKVMCWANMFTSFNGRDNASLTLDLWKDLGIDGIKIDFWDGQGEDSLSKRSKQESAENIEKYEAFYQEAAKRRMIVDCHGCNKPTSERRIYPNVVNREAIEGEEFPNRPVGNNVFLSLVRTAVGPGDFTPATLPLPGFQTNLTVCNNMALAVQLESGIPTFSGEITDYWDVSNDVPTTIGEFYQNIPSTWDETRLVGYDLENASSVYCTVARRKGDTWYVGGSSNSNKNVTIDFSFLDEGEYTLTTWSDDENNKNVAIKTSKDITKTTQENVAIKTNGGFVMKIIKK